MTEIHISWICPKCLTLHGFFCGKESGFDGEVRIMTCDACEETSKVIMKVEEY